MKLRLTIFIVATLLSTLGILAPAIMLEKIFNGASIDFNRAYVIFIFTMSWVFYFLLAYGKFIF